MPRNDDLKKILLIGSGPIVIGQGCEFDYSGVQACKALREERYEVVLVNSNPATIMTDPEFADRTYIEPITAEVIEAIMEREKPDAILPTLGGQTALNAAMELNRNGALARHGVKLIGANAQAIAKGEDRQLFKEAMLRIGLEVPRSGVARSLADLDLIIGEIGTFPLIIRPAFTLGGTGGGIAYNREELDVIAARGLDLSPVHEVLIEESLVGWKEFEMEVMRDRMDNCVVVCSIENFDPMGVHTGDSITVAPVQTLTDKEYQMMRDAAFAVIREIGVETGGSNIQFAVHPDSGRMVVIEMNPRVSRSSALASKATGFPIAKIAAKLAVGYTLDEIKNDITRETPACFEPTIDYCVVKVPRFTFEKFPQADATLTTRMKSVGEAMAIGRTFKEALQRALRRLEIKRFGLLGDGADRDVDPETLRLTLTIPNAERIFYIAQALQKGASIEEVYELTKIDRWFLRNVQQIVEEERALHRGTGILPVGPAGVSPAVRKSGCQPDSANEHLARRAIDRRAISPIVDSTATVDFQFHALDPRKPIAQKRGHVPHWEQRGATYFVTFRLADAIPADLLAQWKQERNAWLKLHPQPWDWRTAREYMRRFEEEREQWLDKGHGACLLREKRAAAIVADSLSHFDRQRYVLDAYVVMPNLVHVLFKPLGESSLGDILHSWKSFTAQAVNREMNRAGALWMHESFDTIIRDAGHLRACREYIEQNPEKARLPRCSFALDRRDALLTDTDTGSEASCLTRPSGCQLDIVSEEQDARPPSEAGSFTSGSARIFLGAKKLGFSDRQLAVANSVAETRIRAIRKSLGIIPTYRLVDTCAAEFEAYTPYYYSTYGDENERRDSDKRKIEPLTLEDVLNIYDQEQPEGVFVQFGGQTPLNLASGLKAAGVPILGTQTESIETAEDRKLFAAMLDKLGLRQTPNGSAISTKEAVAIAKKIGYPVLVRPSFVLGGRAMELVYTETDLRRYMTSAIEVTPDRPVLIDRFLEEAIEVDVDCISDGETTVIGAIMEHIEEAGIHSGDSACVIPTFSLSQKVLEAVSLATKAMARELNVRGLMNVQFAVKDDEVYVLEVNPRASRTVPFVSKAIGIPLAKLAAKVMTGKSLRELGFTKEIIPKHFSVKEAVFPFLRYEGLDISLGPEMKSTGEVMGIDVDLGLAYAKSQMAAPPPLPKRGRVFVSVKDADKEAIIPVAREYLKLGFEIVSTSGTAEALTKAKIKVTKVLKIHEGRPNVLDRIKNGDINFIINTPTGKIPREHEVVIRNAALAAKIPIMTTVRAALASANGIRSLQKRKVQVRSLQEYHASRR